VSKALRIPDYLGHILQAIERITRYWLVMYTMRNRVSHGYDKVDLEIVWRTVQRDLPTLYRQVQALVA
jgi:uncharacterized protein with HEPN domain